MKWARSFLIQDGSASGIIATRGTLCGTHRQWSTASLGGLRVSTHGLCPPPLTTLTAKGQRHTACVYLPGMSDPKKSYMCYLYFTSHPDKIKHLYCSLGFDLSKFRPKIRCWQTIAIRTDFLLDTSAYLLSWVMLLI